MIRLFLHARFQRRIEELGPELKRQAQATLTALQNDFGNPHVHSGLGIRKLRHKIFEVRVGKEYRIVLLAQPGALTAYDIMNHDDVRAYLKS